MIFDKIRNKSMERRTTVDDWKELYSFENGYDITPFSGELKESTYFSCIKIISESIAKCSIQIKQETDIGEIDVKDHYLCDLLKLRPNGYSNAVDVFKTFVAIAKHYGISGLYIDKKGSKVSGLYPVKITGITVDDAGLIKSTKNNRVLYTWQGVNGEYGDCFEKDLIILRDFSMDGVNAKATKSIISESLNTSINSQNYLSNLFKSGLTNKLVVQMTSDIRDEKEIKKLQEKFSRIYSNNNKIVTIPSSYNLSSLNLTLADSQFAELRFMSKKDLCGAMGVPLSKLGETSGTAKSAEQENLTFLTDTLQVIFESIEQELDYKLLTQAEREKGYKIRFNIASLLRMDAQTQANVITTYVKEGIYSLNMARRILGVELLDRDVITFPSGQVTLEQLLSGNVSYANKAEGGDGNGSNT